MATGTNGIATINDLVDGKYLNPPGEYGNKCPTKALILTMGGAVSAIYDSNQLVKYSDVTGITRELVVYNWGNVPIYNLQFTLENTTYLTTDVVYMAGQSISARGGSGYGSHGENIIGAGSGYIKVVGPIIVNGGSWAGTNKIHLSAVTNLTNGTKPSNWNNSLGAYYFTSGTQKLKIDLNFP